MFDWRLHFCAFCREQRLGVLQNPIYGAFSVSSTNVPAVVRYIQNQGAHHQKMNFDADFVALLKKHGMEFDSKFVFG